VAAPAPAPAPLQQLRSDLASTSDSPSPAAVEPIANTALPQTVAAPAVANFAPATLARLEPLAPRLLKMVEPDVPIRVLDQIGSRREAVVEFVVKPDGSVSDINLLAPAPRVLQRFVVEALSQWRYAPLPEARTLRVQLVFSGT
jgi:protein TonB